MHLADLGAYSVAERPGIFRARMVRFVGAWGLGANFSRTTVAAAPIAERIHQLRQLPQVWRAGGAEVSGLSHRDRYPAFRAQGATRHVQHSCRIQPGMRPVPLGAQRGRLPADQVGHQDFQS